MRTFSNAVGRFDASLRGVSLKYLLGHITWWWRPVMKRELDPPKKSGESLRTRHVFFNEEVST